MDRDFVSFTYHLERLKKEEMQSLQRVKSKHVRPVEKQIEPILPHNTQTVFQTSPSSLQVKEVKLKIDEIATVIKGKLVYLQEEDKKEKDLLAVLKTHSVRCKDFIYGERDQILREIQLREAMKEDETIRNYLSKYVNQENTSNIEITEWFCNAKDHLFTDV